MVREVKPRRTTTISRKHQVTIPIDALRAAGLAAGDRLEVAATNDGCVVLRRADNPYRAFAGSLTGVYPPGYLDELRGEWR